jgi:hypothetical protein
MDKLLSPKTLNAVIKVGNKLNPGESPTVVTGGSSSTRQIPEMTDTNSLMKDALGSEQTNKSTTLSNSEQNALYKRFLSGDEKSSMTSSMTKSDLAFRTLKPKSAKLKEDKDDYTGLRNVSIASPFYQQ